ncbi:unnamed protein product [Durusdinium trenchii]|uniref:Transmembrane protein n=1 Tax=Durusdinium trenchii TaxID=1381693 RepID=A0ABP0IIB4_9DINO
MAVVVSPPASQPPELHTTFSTLFTTSNEEKPDQHYPTNAELLQAICQFHDSISAHLEKLSDCAQSIQGPANLRGQRNSDASVCSVRSNNSEPPVLRSASNSAKKCQASSSVAMQALQMDISNLVPVRTARRRESLGSSVTESWAMGRLKEKKDKQVKLKDPEDSPSPSLRVLPVPGVPDLKKARDLIEDPAKAPAETPLECAEKNLSIPRISTDDAMLGRGSNEKTLCLDREASRGSERGTGLPFAVQRSSSQPRAGREDSQSSGRESLQRSRRASFDLQRAVSKANITEVFKVREMELTANLTPKGVMPHKSDEILIERSNEDDDAFDTVHERTPSWWLRLRFLDTFVSCHLSKALGLVSLFREGPCLLCRNWASRLYHWLLLSYLLYGVLNLTYQLSICHDQANECSGAWPPLAVDLFLLLGACMVLMSLGGFLRYKETTTLVAQSAEELSSYCQQNMLDDAWKIWSSSDALSALCVWFMLLFGRFGLYVYRGGGDADALDLSVLSFGLTYAISTGVLVVACFWQVRTSHAMLLIVNSWSASLLQGDASCMESKASWRRVSGLFRKTSRTFERCFAALGFIIVMLVLAALYDLIQGRGVLWTHASTTTACNRLPSLVTLIEADDEEEDREYMGLALYLSLSECGFFVWDTCVTLSLVQKFLYFTAAIAGTIGFQTGALNFQSRGIPID